jgi:hypothetical protein
MTELRERIERWCREESLELAIAKDDEGGLDCALPVFGEPPLAITIRSAPGMPGRLLLAHTFECAIPDELAATSEGAQRFAGLAEAVALARSALVECRPSWGQGRASAEVVVTVFAEGLTKQSFLTGLDEVRKVGLLLGRELEAASLTAGVLAEVQSIVAQSAAFISPPATEPEQAEGAESVVEEDAPPAVEPSQPQAETAVVAEQSDASSDVFCRNCGQQMRSDARFCRSCGANLKGE